MIRFCFALTSLLLSSTLWAQTAAFGITLGESTVADLKRKYNAEYIGVNDLSGGPVYVISGSQISFDQLQEVQVVFNEDSHAVGVMATFPPTKFDYLKDLLSEQYEEVSNEVFGDGFRLVIFRETDITIELDGPPAGNIAVVYVTPMFSDAIAAAEAGRLKEQEIIERQIEEEKALL